jgi:hypothetical protein
MNRYIDHDTREPEIRPQDLPEDGRLRDDQGRERVDERGQQAPFRECALSESQLGTLAEIGRFRTVANNDLEHFRYQNDTARMRQDCRPLLNGHLIQTRSLWRGRDKERLTVVTLTREGKRLLEQAGQRETFYAGFAKPGEIAHDAAIYRMYQAEAARIGKEGGQIRRITLDYELKRRVYSPLAKERPHSEEYKKRQAEVAAQYGLKVVRGHIQLPDLRIEYQTANGEIASRDLELATPHYRAVSSPLKPRRASAFTPVPKIAAVSAPSLTITTSPRRSSPYEL